MIIGISFGEHGIKEHGIDYDLSVIQMMPA